MSLFILNRDLANRRQLEIDWQDRPPVRVLSANMLTGDDLKAFNSFDLPTRVSPTSMGPFTTETQTITIEMPPRSYAVIQWQM